MFLLSSSICLYRRPHRLNKPPIKFFDFRLFNNKNLTYLCLFLLSPINTATADNKTLLCPVDKRILQNKPATAFSKLQQANTFIQADNAHSDSSGTTVLKGHVKIEQHLLRVNAKRATYNKQQNFINLFGDVRIVSPNLSLNAAAGSINLTNKNQQGKFNHVTFFLPKNNMKGIAKSLLASENNQVVLQQASITTCPLQNPDWALNAKKIWLDNNDEYGSANHVILRFKDIPFLYLPYIEFPTTDKRRTGLLFPNVGFSSAEDFEFSMPWYWNIATNQDAVLTPHYMKKRGLALETNYRFLTQSTTGVFDGSYLNTDKVSQQTRYQLRYQQKTVLTKNLLFETEINDVSDADYFNDFNDSIYVSSKTHLNRDARLSYHFSNWSMSALVEAIKTIDDNAPLSNRPYKRLPQLTLRGATALGKSHIVFNLNAELVDFAHDDDNKVTGTRLTLQPSLQLPLTGSSWFLTPAIKLKHTQYELDDNSLSGKTDIASQVIPIFSLDTGLFFERNLKKSYIQTLEPRLFYLHVPHKNQDDNPIFDTSTPEFSVAQLFRDNRFIGADRLGDANQLTVSLTTKIVNLKTAKQALRASIGQIFYFEDRNVSLNKTVATANQSDIIAELDLNWQRWKSNIDLQWSPKYKDLSKQNYLLHYKTDANHLFNLGYRKQLKNNGLDIEQTDTSFVYAFNPNYTAYLRWSYSLKDNRDIDTIAGIAYNSCCWSIQLLVERRLQNSSIIEDPYRNSILIQFVFKGLGSLSGSHAKTTLQNSIYGYTDTLR